MESDLAPSENWNSKGFFTFFLGVFALLVASLDEISLALMVFAGVAWYTLPWAYLEIIEKRLKPDTERLQREGYDPKTIEKTVGQPMVWLRYGQMAYFGSALLLLFQELLGIFEQYTVGRVSGYATGFAFICGLAFFSFATFETTKIVWYSVDPKYKPRVLFRDLVGFLVALATFSLTTATLYQYLPAFSTYALILRMYLISSVASYFGYVLLLRSYLLKRRPWNAITIALLILPWLLLGVADLTGLVH